MLSVCCGDAVDHTEAQLKDTSAAVGRRGRRPPPKHWLGVVSSRVSSLVSPPPSRILDCYIVRVQLPSSLPLECMIDYSYYGGAHTDYHPNPKVDHLLLFRQP